jgi:hypothetical protein
MDKESLLLHKCWTWDAERENLIPISEESIGKIEITDIFCRAKIKSVNGIIYLGYIHEDLWNFGLFHQNEEFGFNISCPEYFLQDIKKLLNDESATLDDFFPVSYQIENNEFVDKDLPLSGIIDFRPNLK